MNTWHRALWRNTGARAWLRNRGLMSETLSRARLGFVETELEEFGRFLGCIAIPYLNGSRDRVIGFAFRRPPGSRKKYDRLPGQTATLYNISATEEETVYITEGEFDALVLEQMGYAACGVPGATHFQRFWRYLFRDCLRAVIVFDSDEAGRRGAMRVSSALLGVVPQVDIVELPIGKDVTDLYLEDPLGLREMLA